MDEVATGISDEVIINEVLAECVAAINSPACGPGKVTGRPSAPLNHAGHHAGHTPFGPHHPPRLLRTDAIYLGGWAIGRNARKAGRHVVKLVPPRVTIVVHVHADMIAVVARETVT